jgi:hypothetical protein
MKKYLPIALALAALATAGAAPAFAQSGSDQDGTTRAQKWSAPHYAPYTNQGSQDNFGYPGDY